MKIRIESTEEIQLRGDNRGKTLLVAKLDVLYYDFIRFDARMPRPSHKAHHEQLRLRVKLTRPDGSKMEPFASIALVNGKQAPAIVSFEGVLASDIPASTEVELLRYETHAV